MPLFLGLAILSWRAVAHDDLTVLEEEAWRAAVDVVEDAVVQIRLVGGLDQVDGILIGGGPTTGLVVSEDGWILTSAYPFARRPASILVLFSNGDRLPARLVATDHSRLLALLKVDPPGPLATIPEFRDSGRGGSEPGGVPAGELGSGQPPRVGQWAIAVGRTLRVDVPNLSVGIVSAVDRLRGRAIQTDAKISVANYGGPLIDIRGRLLGVLVPMTPGPPTEVADIQWYDSGIGFAVPLADIHAALPKMRAGTDLYPGLLGIALAPGAPYRTPARIEAVRPLSPAEQAGLEPEDRITAVAGRPVATVAQFQAAIGPRYAGETVSITCQRGSDPITSDIELVAELPRYHQPFLGLLMERIPIDADGKDPEPPAPDSGVPVRYVFPESPADVAGIERGARLIRIDDRPVTHLAELMKLLNRHAAGATVDVEWVRNGTKVRSELVTIRLPETVPEAADLPAIARPKGPPSSDRVPKPELGAFEITLPEFPNRCHAFVPEDYRPDVPFGLVLWLEPNTEPDPDSRLQRWRAACQRHALIVLLPQASDPGRWRATDVEYLSQLLATMTARYTIDRHRIAVGGDRDGARMAALFTARNRAQVRGMVLVNAAWPAQLPVPVPDPMYRLAIYAAGPAEGREGAEFARGIDRLRAAGSPVTDADLGATPREFTDVEIDTLARWIDVLDRI